MLPTAPSDGDRARRDDAAHVDAVATCACVRDAEALAAIVHRC